MEKEWTYRNKHTVLTELIHVEEQKSNKKEMKRKILKRKRSRVEKNKKMYT